MPEPCSGGPIEALFHTFNEDLQETLATAQQGAGAHRLHEEVGALLRRLDLGWTAHAWSTSGGYGGGRGGVGDANRHRERIYFSPACIAEDGGLFDLLDGGAA